MKQSNRKLNHVVFGRLHCDFRNKIWYFFSHSIFQNHTRWLSNKHRSGMMLQPQSNILQLPVLINGSVFFLFSYLNLLLVWSLLIYNAQYFYIIFLFHSNWLYIPEKRSNHRTIVPVLVQYLINEIWSFLRCYTDLFCFTDKNNWPM